VLNKSGVSVSLEEHLPISLFLYSFSHCLPTVRAGSQPCGYPCEASARNSFPAAKPCTPLHCRAATRVPVTARFSFFDLGSLSVVYLEFARLDTSLLSAGISILFQVKAMHLNYLFLIK